MARRGRGSTSARTRTTTGGRDGATNGSVIDDVAPGDEPGARTIGAMALKRWAARGPDRGDGGDEGGDIPATYGPWDEADVDGRLAGTERVDFGAVQVPVPHEGEVSVEPEDGRLQAVHVMLPAGRLSVSALAAPRTERLWPDLAAEIDESLREGGATVRSFTGEWGRELHARTGDASSLFLGVDGPRWMLYGVATGPTSSAEELDVALRVMLRGTVVVRGRSPYPVRTVLPLTVPEQLPPPERVPVPRMPADRALPSRRTPPAPPAEAPTTITRVPDGFETVPHGIPRRVPGAISDVEAPDGPRGGRPARPAAAAPAEPPATDDGTGVETGASRTASRGLFRRKPERPQRPSNRPPQRRVSELIAEAERDRTSTERPGSGPRRPVSPAGDPGRGTPAAAASGPPAVASGSTRDDRRPTNGQGVDGGRAGGFVSREPTHDRLGPASVYGAADHGAHLDAPFADGTVGGSSTNGSAVDSPDDGHVDGSHANGTHVNGSFGTGSYGDEPYANGSYSNGAYSNGAYSNGSYADGSYSNGSHVDPRLDETSVNGIVGSHPDEPFGPDWPSLGSLGYRPPSGSSEFGSPEREASADRPSGGSSFSEEWSLGYGSSGFGTDRSDGPSGHGTGSGFGADHGSRYGADTDFGADHRTPYGADTDYRSGLGDAPGGGRGFGADDSTWAPATTGIGSSRAASGLAADGSDDWTLPLPVVRPAEPPDPGAQPPRSRRARRAAAEAIEPDPWAAERPTPDDWTRNSRAGDRRADRGWTDEGWAADVREPGRTAGARSMEGSRYGGGHRAPEAAIDRPTRSSRRSGSAHTRHAEEWDGMSGPVDRGRHRRPDH